MTVKDYARKLKIKEKLLYYLTLPYRLATAKRRALPDFLIISTQKGGTTSLLRLLEQHPQIHAPHTELHYFSNDSNYQKGSLWYRSHLPLRSALVPGDVAGEKTPGYLFSSKAAERINEDLPNAKLIGLLRNPTERAISHYFMALRKGTKQHPISEAMMTREERPRSFKKRGPKEINLWLLGDPIKRKKHGAGEILDGDWDLDTQTLGRSNKFVSRPLYQSIVAHFKDGVPWEKTSLFQGYLLKRMRNTGVVRGVNNMQELIDKYNDKVDKLYDSVRKEGILLPSKGRPKIDFMYVHIGRGGEIIWTGGGNHRLFIARYLNIGQIPVRVWWRHKKWQKIREKLNADRSRWGEDWVKPYLNHPDLEDIPQRQK